VCTGKFPGLDAATITRAFGEAVFDVIRQEPERLREVTGIGPKRAVRIIAGWAEQKVIREIMLFLHSNGVGTSRAVRIYLLPFVLDVTRMVAALKPEETSPHDQKKLSSEIAGEVCLEEARAACPNPARAPNSPAANTALSRSVRNLSQIRSFIKAPRQFFVACVLARSTSPRHVYRPHPSARMTYAP
jgi:hypothetical protein